MSNLQALLHRLAEAAHRPADHPLDELHADIDAAFAEAPAPAAAAPSDPDTPAPVFGTESAPESA